jgi:thioredoxin 1
MAVQKVTQADWQKEVLDYKGKVFVDFFAVWCGPCKVTSPIVEELSNEIKDMKFVSVDVDQNPQLSQQYSIFSIPTFMIFKDGKLAGQFVGAMGKEGFLDEIKKTA